MIYLKMNNFRVRSIVQLLETYLLKLYAIRGREKNSALNFASNDKEPTPYGPSEESLFFALKLCLSSFSFHQIILMIYILPYKIGAFSLH